MAFEDRQDPRAVVPLCKNAWHIGRDRIDDIRGHTHRRIPEQEENDGRHRQPVGELGSARFGHPPLQIVTVTGLDARE